MSNEFKMLRLWALIVVVVLLAPAGRAQPQLVFDNSTFDLNTRLNPGTNEVGDQIVLAPGTGRNLTSFAFQYWGLNFAHLNIQADVRFYANDGAPSTSGPNMPGTLLFDSGWFSVVQTNRATLTFSDFVTGAAFPLTGQVPSDFTWSIQFTGLGPSATAGVDLYNPPTVGSDSTDYWFNNGSSWDLLTMTNGTPVNFAAQITATPEPSVVWLSLLGGLTLLGFKWRRSRK